MKKLLTLLNILLLAHALMAVNVPLTRAELLTPEKLFYGFESGNETKDKIEYVSKLPQGTWQEIVTSVIKIILAISGSLALASFTVSGIMMVVARGEEEKLTKAKHVLLWSIAALAIIAVSYAIVLGISQLKFFSGS